MQSAVKQLPLKVGARWGESSILNEMFRFKEQDFKQTNKKKNTQDLSNLVFT